MEAVAAELVILGAMANGSYTPHSRTSVPRLIPPATFNMSFVTLEMGVYPRPSGNQKKVDPSTLDSSTPMVWIMKC